MYVSIGKASYMLGVSATSLRRWDNEKRFQADYRTVGGHRRYKLLRLMDFQQESSNELVEDEESIKEELYQTPVVTYSRVSSSR